MTSVLDLRVVPVAPSQRGAIRALRLAPGQADYVGDIGLNLDSAESDPDSEAMAILADGVVVGFYRLDHRPTAVSRRRLDGRCAVLRALVIDQDWQGRGLARQVLLSCCNDLARRHPACRLLALNVDCRNTAAARAYRGAGFVDSGELHAGGRAGPQRLLLRAVGA
ncbi:GNAT family N-acetyltransferase [Luteimonas vadosa]|uniref:N-acetyltransferase domain-containing protein n=1 Tax=Luteimonas vadosa TaxID=1165507 RepID=A0ABP9DTL6_9GAMM